MRHETLVAYGPPRTLALTLRGQWDRRGLSQQTFASVPGLHRTDLARIERAERNPSLRTVERIAQERS